MTPEGIRAARQTLGLTQRQLAASLGVGPLAVSRWERGVRTPGRPTIRLLEQLVRARKEVAAHS